MTAARPGREYKSSLTLLSITSTRDTGPHFRTLSNTGLRVTGMKAPLSHTNERLMTLIKSRRPGVWCAIPGKKKKIYIFISALSCLIRIQFPLGPELAAETPYIIG